MPYIVSLVLLSYWRTLMAWIFEILPRCVNIVPAFNKMNRKNFLDSA